MVVAVSRGRRTAAVPLLVVLPAEELLASAGATIVDPLLLTWYRQRLYPAAVHGLRDGDTVSPGDTPIGEGRRRLRVHERIRGDRDQVHARGNEKGDCDPIRRDRPAPPLLDCDHNAPSVLLLRKTT